MSGIFAGITARELCHEQWLQDDLPTGSGKTLVGLLIGEWLRRKNTKRVAKPDQPDFTHLNRKVKELIRAAGLRDELSFTSFRHGGFHRDRRRRTDDREIMVQGRHKSVKMSPRYVKRSMNQVAAGAQRAAGIANEN